MGFIILAIILGGVVQLLRLYVTARGKIVQRKIGSGVGMTFAEMRRRLGTPNAQSVNEDGDMVYQWIQASSGGAYHYAYVFRNGICRGIAYQYKG